MAILEMVLQTLIPAIATGCVYGALCAALSLTFGIMKFVNFAQAEFMAAGMYLGYFLTVLICSYSSLPPFAAAVVASFAAFGIFYFIGRILHSSLLSRVSGAGGLAPSDRGHQSQLVVTLGLSLIMQNAALLLFGSAPRSISNQTTVQAWLLGSDDLMIFVNKGRFLIAIVAVFAVLLIQVVLKKTVLGTRMRGASDDSVAAVYVGIDTEKCYGIAFGLSVGLTAMIGALVATYYPFHPYVGLDFLIIMYAGVILGGLGSFLGAFLGGGLIGFVQQASNLVMPIQLQNAVVFLIFLLTIVLRPQGIFGKKVERV